AYFTLYGLVKYLPPPVGNPLRYGVLKLFCARIRSWRIQDGVTIWFPEGVRIGERCSFNENVYLDGFGGITIGDDCRIAHNVSFVSEDHVFADPDTPIRLQGKETAEIHIGSDVWIGCGARILKGVTVGDGAVIGAGAIVTRDVPPLGIAVGVPARIVGTRGEKGTGSAGPDHGDAAAEQNALDADA
ncbi:MAG: acyltransferase, partial [Planctomycetota bacterium]